MDFQRIATEEAFAPSEIIERWRVMLGDQLDDEPGFRSLWGYFLESKSEFTTQLVSRLQDLEAQRLHDMDESGIAKQIISLTAPGVQVFEAATATSLAESSNDQLAEAVRKHPDRFAGLAAIAPQNPPKAAQELERGVKVLGLKGVVINSHTRGEYLDDPKFWDIFEAAQALDVPIYLHPRTPSKAMIAPYLERGLDGAIFGFAAETGLHLLRMITGGVFDRFPRLKLVVGHLGEAIPFWLFRIDHMHAGMVRANRHKHVQKLQKKPSEYMRENIYLTTSGMAWEPAIMFVHSVLGADRLLYAMDYPYQYVPAEVEVTDNLPISDVDKKKLYQLNAEKLFALS